MDLNHWIPSSALRPVRLQLSSLSPSPHTVTSNRTALHRSLEQQDAEHHEAEAAAARAYPSAGRARSLIPVRLLVVAVVIGGSLKPHKVVDARIRRLFSLGGLK